MNSHLHPAMGNQMSVELTNAVDPARVDEIFAYWNRADSPGSALAVLQGGRTVYQRGYGMADLSHDAVIVPSTPFHVASVSKQFTAAAILLLAQEGALTLEDDVRRYLPELHDFGHVIRIRHLLHNTSGLRDQWDLLGLASYRESLDWITDEDVLQLVIRQQELNFPPGSEYLYSNTGYTLAAQILKRVTGESFREFTSKRIFAPLGMTRTHFRDDHREINRGEALGYQRMDDGSFRLWVTNFDTVGATGLYTTVEDLAKWDENFYESNVGGAGFTRTMTCTDRLSGGDDNFYAMGLLLLMYRGLPVVEHGGADAGYRANILRFPGQHFSVVTLWNTPVVAAAVNRQVADLYLASHFPKPPTPSFGAGMSAGLPRESLEGKPGAYRSCSSGLIVRIDIGRGALQIVNGGQRIPLLTDGRGRFLLPDSIDPLRFEPALGTAERLIVQGEGKPVEIWDRMPEFSLPVSIHQEFIGHYHSDELDAGCRIEEWLGKLVLIRKKFPADELTPAAADLFTVSLGVLKFTRGANEIVCAMHVTTARVRDLKYIRVHHPARLTSNSELS